MTIYFCFSAPIVGPISEPGGGFNDLILVTPDRQEAERICREAIGPDAIGHRADAWFNEFDSETLVVGSSVRFGE